jgi:hypothetical protein
MRKKCKKETFSPDLRNPTLLQSHCNLVDI